MRILIVSEQFWPEYAGWLNQIFMIFGSFPEQGWSLNVITRKLSAHNREQAPLKNLEIIQVKPNSLRKGNFFQFLFIFPTIKFLIQKREQFDIIFLPISFLPAPLVIPFAKVLRKPVVSRIAISEFEGRNVFSTIRKFLIRCSDAIVFLNKETLDHFKNRSNGSLNMHFIPNGVNISDFANKNLQNRKKLKADYGINESSKVLCYVGIINQRKGVDILLESFRKVKDTIKEVQLLLIGPMEDVNELNRDFVAECKNYVIDQKMSKSVQFTGRKSNIHEFLSSADIFILPSHQEGMPNVLLEAMAAGLPCIGSDIPGIRGVITHNRNGILIEPGDIDSLAFAITRLLEDEKLRKKLGKNARKYVKENHSIEKIAGIYENLFIRLIKSKKI